MSAQEQSYLGVTHKPRPSTALPAPVTAVAGSARLQLAALLTLAGGLNLWALSRNGWANTYYSAAVRSMSSSWHDFLFGAMDRAGVMTVDKPPLALWVQALSVRVFGYHPLSMLVPQTLMGVASVALVYDLVGRRFGRLGGFVAGLALALTPITVGVSRHNNPDALLVLCCVAAVWCAVRALEDGRHRVRWLVGAGVCVGLGFETKMAVALMVVPGIVAAWLWIAPHGRRRALGELLGAGGAMALVGGAWPALVELTPAADRPWVSGTSDNTVWQLIAEYNGAGRLDGQTGGPGGIGGSMFGGTPGPLRLLNSALGGQAGWLLGFALVSGVAVLLASRLRRGDARSGWLIVVGGAFVATAVVFSEAHGIFHPYYVSLLAPFAAALTGAGVAQLRKGGLQARVLAPLAIVAGVACEVAVLHQYPDQLTWVVPVLIVVGAGGAVVLGAFTDRAIRTAALSCGVAALLIAPGVWAVDTLGYATNGTFPSGGPRSALIAGGRPGGGFGARVRGVGTPGGVPLFGAGSGARAPGGAGEGPPLPPGGAAGPPAGAGGAGGGLPGAGGSSMGAPSGARPGAASGMGARLGGGGGPVGAPLGNDRTISAAIAYARAHGGGTVAVSSQSSAASAIVSDGADVAGIGGFSGRESDVSVAQAVPDAVVLDVGLPGIDGLEVCRALRRLGNRVPVLMLTARDAVSDRIDGLDVGADDYMVKPFDVGELKARIRALLRRAGPEGDPEALAFAEVRLDRGRHGAEVNGELVELTRTEYQLLELLMLNPKRVLAHSLIYDRVWGYDFGPASNALRVYVGYLRRKLEGAGARQLIHTVRGVGYVLREP